MDARILSVRQPWAELIVAGHKSIENRSWKTDYRGLVLIHASRTDSDVTPADIKRMFGVRLNPERCSIKGGVIGSARLADCVTYDASPWFSGPYGWVMIGAKRLPFIEWQGRLGLVRAPDELIKRLRLAGESA